MTICILNWDALLDSEFKQLIVTLFQAKGKTSTTTSRFKKLQTVSIFLDRSVHPLSTIIDSLVAEGWYFVDNYKVSET